MAGVSLTASMRANLLSLQNTTKLMDMTADRLSTGRKVNSALDDPSAFFTAKGLTNRADDLSALLDGMGQTLQTLKAAEKGIAALTDLVKQAKAVADEAYESAAAAADTGKAILSGTFATTTGISNSGTITVITSSGRNDITVSAGDTLQDVVDAINAIDGMTASIDSNSDFVVESSGSFTIEGLENAVVGTHTYAQNVDGYHSGKVMTLGIKLTDTLAFQSNGHAINIASSGTNVGVMNWSTDIDTGADLYNEIKSDLSGDFQVGVNSDGYITIEYTGSGTTPLTVATGGSNAHNVFLGASIQDTNSAGMMQVGTSVNNDSLVEQFNDLRTQIDAMVEDTGYKGINLLNGSDLTVYFNEDRTSSLAISGVKYDAAGLGVTAASGWTTTDDIQSSIDVVNDAIDTLRAQEATFGRNASVVQTREEFTTNMINTLTEGSDKLTLADMNEEGANMLALQTRQQLATSSLSMASQASQSVLSLFR